MNNVAPRRLNNVRVLVNDLEAFVAFTSSAQINAIAPDNLIDGPVTVLVEYSNLRSTSVPSQSRRINPAVFRFTPQNSRYLASTANDGTAYIGPANLFGTNGSLNGLVPCGRRVPANMSCSMARGWDRRTRRCRRGRFRRPEAVVIR